MSKRSVAAVLLFLGIVALALGCRKSGSDFDSAPLIDADELSKTDVLPHLAGPLQPGRNYVYCATFDLAWDELCMAIGEPVELHGAEDWSRWLNENPFDKSHLSSDSYLARGGRVDENIVADIRRELAERFPHATMGVPDATRKNGVYIYAYLAKSLRFKQAFEQLGDPVRFQSNDGTTTVDAFGVKCFSHLTDKDEARSDQVRILDYISDDDFILEVYTVDRADQLVLAKVPPDATLGATIAAVQQRIASEQIKYSDRAPRYEEMLAVPFIGLFVERQFDELVGKRFLNAGYEDASIGQARQAIRFRLDEEGAEVESVADVEAAAEAFTEEMEKPRIRKFIFNKSFLAMLSQRDAKQPYFVLWIANSEILRR